MSLPLPGRTALSWTCGDTDVTLWHAQGCLRVNDAMWSHIYPVLGLLARSLHVCAGSQRARIAVHVLMSVVLARRAKRAVRAPLMRLPKLYMLKTVP
jgi:hypothetical protein